MNGDTVRDVFRAIDVKRPIRVKLGKVGCFSGEDYDVVYVEVESNGVEDLHDRLKTLPHVAKFKDFRPHVTIALVKPGLGPVYAARFGRIDLECVCDIAILSTPDRTRHVYPLGRTITVNKAAMSYLNSATGGAMVAAPGRTAAARRKRRRLLRARIEKAFAELGVGAGRFVGAENSSSLTQEPFDAEEFVFGTKAFDPNEAWARANKFQYEGAVEKAWDESKHPRDHGRFSEKPGAEGERGSSAPIEPNEETLDVIGYALRQAMEEAVGDPKDQCIACAYALKTLYPEAVVYSGTYAGEPHILAKLGGKFLDVTADQFDNSPDVQVLDPEDMPREYRRYTEDAEQHIPGVKWHTQHAITEAFRRTLQDNADALREQGSAFVKAFHPNQAREQESAFVKAFDESQVAREKTEHDGKRPGEFAPKGDDGEPGRSPSPKMAPRAHAIAKAAAEIPFTDAVNVTGKIDTDDLDAVRDLMTGNERSRMDRTVGGYRDDWVDEQLSLYDLDVDPEDVAKEIGWDDRGVQSKASDLASQLDDPDEADGAKELIDRWYSDTRKYGADAVEELAGVLEDDFPELADQVRDLASDAQDDIDAEADKERDRLTEERRSELEDEYDDSDDVRDYLREFLSDHEDDPRFSGERKTDVWGKDEDGDDVYAFDTSAGNQYTIRTYDQTHGDHTVKELVFSDSDGKFAVTGSGGAHEVFSKVAPAVTALVTKKNLPALSFTAKEPSRQRLYDRLVRTVAASAPDYTAIAVTPPGAPKRYLVVRRDELDRLRPALERSGLSAETLVKAMDTNARRSRVQILHGATEDQLKKWATADGWPAVPGDSGPSVQKADQPRETSAHNGKRPGEFAPKSTPKAKAAPKLTDDQREALRELMRQFPDGIGHLLDNSGQVPVEHVQTDADREHEKAADEHREAWHAADGRISTEHAANDPVDKLIDADYAINDELNDLATDANRDAIAEFSDAVFSDSADGDQELELATSAIADRLYDIAHSEMPEYPGRPGAPEADADEALDTSDIDGFDEAEDRADRLKDAREERETEADTFAEESADFRADAERASKTFRDEQAEHLTGLLKEINAALAIPEKRWAAQEGGAEMLATVRELADSAKDILSRIHPD